MPASPRPPAEADEADWLEQNTPAVSDTDPDIENLGILPGPWDADDADRIEQAVEV